MLEDANLTEEDIEKSSEESVGTEIVVDGVEYATNLFWQPLQNKDDPYMEVEEASQGILEGADLFCVKPGKAPQFGICVSAEGYKKGQEAAAVPLATALSDKSSFIAVFKVNSGWWYTCIRNDIILSDGDMLFLNEDDAKNQFESMLAVPDWGRKIAPPEWGIEDTDYPDLGRLLQRGARAKLQKIKGLRGPKLYIILACSALVGFWLLFTIITEVFLAPPKVRPVVAPIIPKKIQKVPEVIPESKPWELIKDPAEVMAQCEVAVAKLVSIISPGWKIGDISCSTGSAATVFSRDFGRISWMRQAVSNPTLKLNGKIFSDKGDSMIASMPFAQIKQVTSPPTRNDTALKNKINELFQSLGLTIELRSVTKTSPQKNIYRHVEFKFKSGYKPHVWSELLTKFSGLQINSIKYNTKSKDWEYEGVIYVL